MSLLKTIAGLFSKKKPFATSEGVPVTGRIPFILLSPDFAKIKAQLIANNDFYKTFEDKHYLSMDIAKALGDNKLQPVKDKYHSRIFVSGTAKPLILKQTNDFDSSLFILAELVLTFPLKVTSFMLINSGMRGALIIEFYHGDQLAFTAHMLPGSHDLYPNMSDY
ncbi:hypothetical protein ABNO07_003516 [Salmonella enterica subsp. enterica serovar Bareilly]